jgi:hypothetical protein
MNPRACGVARSVVAENPQLRIADRNRDPPDLEGEAGLQQSAPTPEEPVIKSLTHSPAGDVVNPMINCAASSGTSSWGQ